MAFLNEYKRRAVRRTVEYQVLMEDLIKMGIVDKEDYHFLTGKEERVEEPQVDPSVAPQLDFDGDAA